MSDKFFLETNILVYIFDAQVPPKKRGRAPGLVEKSLLIHDGVVSTQVVQEFLKVATGKFAAPLSLADAYYTCMIFEHLCVRFSQVSICSDRAWTCNRRSTFHSMMPW